ncbi:MAG: hypothetical protein GY816_15265 [Cytophagales bacterium]|nr:hypothetical protein [Cytophagales bacterium]
MDPSQKLSLNDVLSKEYQAEFEPHRKNGFNFGLTTNVIWLRFKISDFEDLNHDNKLVLAIDKPMFPFVDLYVPTGPEKYDKISGGYLKFTKGSTHEYRYPVFKLPQDIAEHQYLFLQVTPSTPTIHAAASFDLILEDENQFRQRTWFELSFYSIMFGVLVCMILYNLFLYVFLRDKVYATMWFISPSS